MDNPAIKKLLEVQRQFSRALEPQRRIQEQLAKALEPQRQMQEQLARALEPQRRIQEQLAKALEPQRQVQEQLTRALEPQHRIQEQLAKAFEPQRRIQEQLAKALEPHRHLQEQLARALEPQIRIQTRIASLKGLQGETLQNIIAGISKFDEIISTAALSEVELVSDDQLSLKGSTARVGELTEQFAVFSAETELSNPLQFLEIFTNWLSQLRGALKTLAIYIFLPYLLAIIANLTTPIYEGWLSDYSLLNQREANKEIAKEAREYFTLDELEPYRFTSATILHVRSEGNINSEIIDELSHGKVVRIVTKDKRWCLVEYNDQYTGATLRGWVFSRYLSKFE